MIKLIPTDDIDEGTSRGIERNSKYLFAIKKDDLFHIYLNSCPHLGTPLEWLEDQFLDEDGALIRCATHGALFDIESGQCLVGPCKGKSLRKIPFVVREGIIMIDENDLKPPPIF